MNSPYDERGGPRRLIRDMPYETQPLTRLELDGLSSLSDAELLALLLGSPAGLDLAYDVLQETGGLRNLPRTSRHELQQIPGIGRALAARIRAAVELGRRTMGRYMDERPRVSSPADAAQLLMSEMAELEQEHLRVILLDTRNHVIEMPTIYIGSLNTSVVRIGEIFKRAIVATAAAVIVAHNHPSGDPSPSPEDINITRQIRHAGQLIDIDVLDHVIIGRGRFVSLKERGLGFND